MKVFLNLQIALITIVTVTLISGCRTVECWVVTQRDPLVIEDTLTLESIHYHYKDLEGSPRCAWVDAIQVPVRDTMWATFYSWQKTRPCKCDQ